MKNSSNLKKILAGFWFCLFTMVCTGCNQGNKLGMKESNQASSGRQLPYEPTRKESLNPVYINWPLPIMDGFMILPNTPFSTIPNIASQEVKEKLKNHLMMEALKTFQYRIRIGIPNYDLDETIPRITEESTMESFNPLVTHCITHDPMTYAMFYTHLKETMCKMENEFYAKLFKLKEEKGWSVALKTHKYGRLGITKEAKEKIHNIVVALFKEPDSARNILMNITAKLENDNKPFIDMVWLPVHKNEVTPLCNLYDQGGADFAAKKYGAFICRKNAQSTDTFKAFLDESWDKEILSQFENISLNNKSVSSSSGKAGKKSDKHKQLAQAQSIPTNRFSKIEEDDKTSIFCTDHKPDLFKQPTIKINARLLEHVLHPRVKKWSNSEEELLSYFQNAPEGSYDAKFKEANDTIDKVAIQKHYHDLMPVATLLEQKDSDFYFKHVGKSIFANAKLEGKDNTISGILELGIENRDKDKKKLIYHQMFRPAKVEETFAFQTSDYEEPSANLSEDEEDDFEYVGGNSIEKNTTTNEYIIKYVDKNKDPTKPYKRLYILPYKH